MDIEASPRKKVCATSDFLLEDNAMRGQLCVTPGNFSSGRYALSLEDRAVLGGIDDQTSKGLTASFRSKSFTLQWTPQNLYSNASADDVRKFAPAYSDAQVAHVVDLMEDSGLLVELGRSCTVSADPEMLMPVHILFD